MLTNSEGNILVANGINFISRKIPIYIYKDINHYNNGDDTFVKKISNTILIPTGYVYPDVPKELSKSSEDSIKDLIYLIIKDIDKTWSDV